MPNQAVGTVETRKCLQVWKMFVLAQILGTFRLDYEYEIEYEYNFRISNQ